MRDISVPYIKSFLTYVRAWVGLLGQAGAHFAFPAGEGGGSLDVVRSGLSAVMCHVCVRCVALAQTKIGNAK